MDSRRMIAEQFSSRDRLGPGSHLGEVWVRSDVLGILSFEGALVDSPPCQQPVQQVSTKINTSAPKTDQNTC